MASSLAFVLDSDLGDDGELLGLFFTATNETNYNEVALKPNGHNIPVTNANKHEFVRLKCHYTAYLAVKKQLELIRKGFYEIIPQNWVSFFTNDELETFICGL